MTPNLLRLLAAIAAHPDGTIDAEALGIIEPTDKLFELGVLTICPPGWQYKVNAVGLALLAKQTAVAA